MIIRNFILFCILGVSLTACAQVRPGLILTKKGTDQIKTGGSASLFDAELQSATELVDKAIEKGIDVPIPKDMAGGYTHEQHKLNYKLMQTAGALYQIKSDKKYAQFIKEMLYAYAEMYPTLPIHPTDRSYSTGKIFWQCLNDSNWLVFTSQAYDCIYDFLSKEDRDYIETKLFRPYADFISVENPQFFNRVHNHSTWGNAAVGMIGIAMGDEELINRALYGLEIKKDNDLAKDNDGGFIYEKGQAKAGFFAQIDHAFSPDGYYTEGPYYQRYAMTPFMLFAQALNNYNPDLKIFEYRDSLLLKAVYALILQSNQSGEFFPINDAQKGMSYLAPSVISSVNIAYGINKDPQLAEIARQQNKVLLDQNGFAIAKAIDEGNMVNFHKKSVELRDGAKGDEGALGILRRDYDGGEIVLVYKYTAQGLGHGHYDKLSYLMYDGDTEVLQDYGAARWVNIDQKAGGRYLKENKSWAKQTIAHNTLVINGQSHFGGVYDIATHEHSEGILFDVSDKDFQIASAKEINAYPGVDLQRTLILWNDDSFTKPIVLDLMMAFGEEKMDFELPYQYQEHLLKTDLALNTLELPEIMGEDHGYQHLYKEATAKIEGNSFQFNWIHDYKFYTLTSVANSGEEVILARVGANDPEFNLRRDAMLIHKKNQARSAVYLSAVESHGEYSTVSEIPIQPYSQIRSLELDFHNKEYTVFTLTSKKGKAWTFMLAHHDTDEANHHKVRDGKHSFEWRGPFHLINKN